jgi:putative proteasome-type protease
VTFCLGMKCEEGLLAIADTRITSGTETSVAKKILVHQGERHSLFILTSGLRSIRDKALTYFEERLETSESGLTRLYRAANALADDLRRVRDEDARWLAESGLSFDLHCIVGGQLEEDAEPHLFLLYPEGNWVEVHSGTPYVIIGESRYGKPVLDRAWSHEQPLVNALRDGLLAFDATFTSASDVDPPVDCVLYRRDTFQVSERRYDDDDLAAIREYWGGAMRAAVDGAVPLVEPLMTALEEAPPTSDHISPLRSSA